MKRTKLVASLMMCVFCLSFLVVGVWAAVSTVNFNLSGQLTFNPEGVYVDIQGQVSRGSSYTTLNALTEPEFSFSDKNYDNSTGETSGNFAVNSWNPAVAFLPAEKYVQYSAKISNKSNEPISVITSGYTDIPNVTAWENNADVLRIDPGESGTYELNLEYTGTDTSLFAEFDVTFDIKFTSVLASEQTGVTFTQSDGLITEITGANTACPNYTIIPKTIDGTLITGFASGTYHDGAYSSTDQNIIFEADITSLGDWTFSISRLQNIKIPASVQSIGGSVFMDLALNSLAFQEGLVEANVYFYPKYPIALVIPKGIKLFRLSGQPTRNLVSVKFLDPTGWYLVSGDSSTEVPEETLADPASAAEFVCNNRGYLEKD
mgnify:CR=1 FL=1